MAESTRELEPHPKRFHASSDADRVKLVNDAVPKKTSESNTCWKRVFDEYCGEAKGKVVDFKTVSAEELASVLESFFVDVRKKNGAEYKKNSLLAARAAIQRLLANEGRKINIFLDREFDLSKKIMAGLFKERKRSGVEESVTYKESITSSDWDTKYFSGIESTTDAVLLCRYVHVS